MSKSYHTTRKDLKGKTKQEIDEMLNDGDSILHELARKRMVKKNTLKERKNNIKQEGNEL